MTDLKPRTSRSSAWARRTEARSNTVGAGRSSERSVRRSGRNPHGAPEIRHDSGAQRCIAGGPAPRRAVGSRQSERRWLESAVVQYAHISAAMGNDSDVECADTSAPIIAGASGGVIGQVELPLSDIRSHEPATPKYPRRHEGRARPSAREETRDSPKVCIGCLLVGDGSELTPCLTERSQLAPIPSFAAAPAAVTAWPLSPRSSHVGAISLPYRTQSVTSGPARGVDGVAHGAPLSLDA